MQKSMIHKLYFVLAVIITLIPVLDGIIVPSDDLTLGKESLQTVYLVASMKGMPEHMRFMRAVTSEPLLQCIYPLMLFAEFCVSIISSIGLYLILFKRKQFLFRGISYAQAGCIWGIIVWGLGFFVTGDFLFTWYLPNLEFFQRDSLMHVLLMVAALIALSNIKSVLSNPKE